MVLEHALLSVRPGREADFETTFGRAEQIIAGVPGFEGLTLSRCLERPGTYLLLVRWRRLEDHTEGRGSPAYQEWRALLHHFYDPPSSSTTSRCTAPDPPTGAGALTG